MTERKSSWIQSRHGRQLFPLDCRPEDLHLDDIASSLSKICRFGGHCKEFYSVAEHSVRVSMVLPDDYASWGLLHDAAEMLIGDIVRPLKRHLFYALGDMGSAEFSIDDIEHQILGCVAKRFNLPSFTGDLLEAVTAADNTLLITEKRDLLTMPPKEWTDIKGDIVALPEKIRPWEWQVSEQQFLLRAKQLGVK